MSALATLRDTRDQSLENFAVGQLEHRVLCNLDTPERDSLAEDIMALREHQVPASVVASLLGRLADAMDLNGVQTAGDRTVCGLLDTLATPRGRAALVDEAGEGVKALATRLRPALRVLARPEAHDAVTLFSAAAIVSAAIDGTAPATLTSGALRHELRPTAHDLLLRLRDGVS